MNKLLTEVEDPEEFKYRIYQTLDYLVYLHQEMNLVNLDIKPKNIFVGTKAVEGIDNIIYMDLGTSMVLSPNEEGDEITRYLVNFAT